MGTEWGKWMLPWGWGVPTGKGAVWEAPWRRTPGLRKFLRTKDPMESQGTPEDKTLSCWKGEAGGARQARPEHGGRGAMAGSGHMSLHGPGRGRDWAPGRIKMTVLTVCGKGRGSSAWLSPPPAERTRQVRGPQRWLCFPKWYFRN